MTQRTLRTAAYSLMVHAKVLEYYIHLALMYTSDHISPILPIKDLINKDGNPTTIFKLTTGMKSSILHLRVLFYPCVIWKSTTQVGTKVSNMRNQAQKGFHNIFFGIP